MASEKTVQSRATLNVKLARGKDGTRARKVLSNVPGLKSVVQTFPDETDPDLANLYVLEVNPTAVGSVLKRLRKNPYVEYVEETARRKLIR